jgi:hypothetical protein
VSTHTTTGAPSAVALLGQLGGAIVGGLLLALLGYIGIGYALLPLQIGMGLLIIQLWAAVAGFGIGAGIGAGLVGRITGRPGNIWLAALVGGVTGFLVILVLRLLNIGGLGALLWVGLPVTLIAAVAAYNWSRR